MNLCYSEAEKVLTYGEFLDEVEVKLNRHYAGERQITRHRITKNNSVSFENISVREKNSNIAPSFYMKHYYEEYVEGKRLEEIVSEMVERLEDDEVKSKVMMDIDFSWETIKDRVTYRLLERERNKEMLESVPYKNFGNFVMVYQYIIEKKSEEMTMVIITKGLERQIGVSDEELEAAATVNTAKLLPAVFRRMEDVIEGIIKNRNCLPDRKESISECIRRDDGYGMRMYVLTNRYGIYGATTIAYKDVVQEITDAFDSGFYVLPSSIHETIIIPAEHAEFETAMLFRDMVSDVNKTQLEPEEILSDKVFYCSREGIITTVA